MNCQVCNSPCNGYHYKIKTCRACAAFFRRTVHMKLRYRCRENGNCVVTKENRYSCRFCRMKKCISVGMSLTEASSVSPEFHLDSTPKSLKSESPPVLLPNLEETEWFDPAAIFENHDKFVIFMKAKVTEILKRKYEPHELPCKLNLCQQSSIAYEAHENKWSRVKRESNNEFNVAEVQEFMADHFKEMIYIAEYFMELEPFTALPFLEKAAVYKRKGHVFIDINLTSITVKWLGTDPDDSRMVAFDGKVFDHLNSKFDLSTVCNLSEENVRELMIGTNILFDKIVMQPFKRIQPDNFEVQYLLLRSIFNLEGIESISKETLAMASRIYEQLDEELVFYYKYEKKLQNVASRIYKLHNLLTAFERIAEIREQDTHMWKTFDIFKLDVCINDLTI